MNKKIVAPLIHDPGRGRPKEHLAYLNWQEMQALQRLNGGNMERGPRGLPSFADDSASSMGTERQPDTSYSGNWTGSPNTGTTYGGSTYGGSDTGSNYDPSSIGSNDSGTTTDTANAAAAGSAVDAAVQAATDVANAVKASQQSAALNEDATRGGIASINVGPMNTPVKIGGGQLQGAMQAVQQQAAAYKPSPAALSAVTRGPGSVSGMIPGNTDPIAQLRSVQGITNSFNDTFGTSYSPDDMSKMARTIAGESLGETPLGQAAVANTMLNRVALSQEDARKYRSLGGATPESLLGKYTAYTNPNQAFKTSGIGTEAYRSGLAALSSAMNPQSEFSKTASPAVLNATHYYNPEQANPSWGARSGREFSALGGHVFGSVDVSPEKVAAARNDLSGLSTEAKADITAAPSFAAPQGFMTPEQQMADRLNTMYSPNTLGNLYKDIGVYGIQDPAKKILAEQQLLGQTIGASQYGGAVTAKKATGLKSPGEVDPFSAGVVAHWTAGSPTQKIANQAYNTIIDAQGNINYQTGFTPSGAMTARYHTFGTDPVTGEKYSTQNLGISSTGIEPNEAQLNAARALGQNWFNPQAEVTTHGYEAGVRAAEREAADPRFAAKNIRQDLEGAALARAFSGTTQQAGYFSPSVLSGASPDVKNDIAQATPAPTGLAGFGIPMAVMTGIGTLAQNPAQYSIGIPEQSGFVKALPDSLKVAAIKKMASDFGEQLPGMVGGWIESAQKYITPSTTETAPTTTAALTPNLGPANRIAQGQVPPTTIGMDPSVLAMSEMAKPQLTAEQVAKIQETAKRGNYGIRAATAIGSLATGVPLGLLGGTLGSSYEEAAMDKVREYNRMTDEEKAAYEKTNPEITKWAKIVGIPTSSGYQYAEAPGQTTFAGSTPGVELGGKGNEVQYAAADQIPYGPMGPSGRGLPIRRRPKIYQRWDRGQGIPSPGDPLYNQYVEYIQLKEQGLA